MDIEPIQTVAEYEAILSEIEKLMDAELGTPDGERLSMLAALVEAFEARISPINEVTTEKLADPIAKLRNA